MDQDVINNIIKVLRTIQEDMERDAKEFDGQPFNGRTVAQYFGCQGAAIASLASILERLVKESVT